MTINSAWEQIERWLQSNAPASYDSLPGPATSDEIRAAQSAVGRQFPEELTESLLRHNGSGEFVIPVLHRLDSAGLIADEYLSYRQAERSRREAAVEGNRTRPHQIVLLPPDEFYYWNPSWTPLAYDESGNSLFISQANDESLGKIGLHEKDGGGSLPQHPALESLTALLEATTQALHGGSIEIWGQWEPFVDDEGYLEWRGPQTEDEVTWGMEEMNRRYGL
ncbi:SMI1/KNR4 family protein [Streptomyces sp. NPDC001820]|uniref:SMI1/KNR4 family protein n=1 Tax=Streptomyces sp. NPDC001820 TaxID=3364613 RepID=UPI00369B869F